MSISYPDLNKNRAPEDWFIYPHPVLNKLAALTIVHLWYSGIGCAQVKYLKQSPATLLNIGLTGSKKLCVKVMNEEERRECFFVCHTAAISIGCPYSLDLKESQIFELRKGWREVNNFHTKLLWRPYKHLEIIDRPASKMRERDLIGLPKLKENENNDIVLIDEVDV